MRKVNKSAVFIFIALLVLIGLFLSYRGNKYTFTQPNLGVINQNVTAIGKIVPSNIVEVKSTSSGIVKQILTKDGDIVALNQPLIEIEADPTPDDLLNAKSNYSVAQADFNTLQEKASRYKKLIKLGYVSRQDYDDVMKAYEDNKLQLTLAKQKLELIQVGGVGATKNNVIMSPANSTVLEILTSNGQPITPTTNYQEGTPLMILGDIKNLYFRGLVSQSDIVKLKIGMPVEIQIDGINDQKIIGTLNYISLVSISSNQTDNDLDKLTDKLFPIQPIFSNGYVIGVSLIAKDDITLKPGMDAAATINIGVAKEELLIPLIILQFDNQKPFVYIYKNHKAEKVYLELGHSDANNIEVTSGLNIEDKIITNIQPNDA